MSNFQGWLLKFGNTVLPNEFILADGWDSTPDHRIELSAYRNANMDLIRVTSPNFKAEIQIKLPKMDLEKKMRLQAIINSAMVDTDQRKVDLTYWNDETNQYESGYFYITDNKYHIHTVNELTKDIEYNSVTMKLVEY